MQVVMDGQIVPDLKSKWISTLTTHELTQHKSITFDISDHFEQNNQAHYEHI